MRKRIDHWCSVVPEASFPTGTVGPRVGIFLFPLNTNDRFYLSHIGKQPKFQPGVLKIALCNNNLHENAETVVPELCMCFFSVSE